MEETISGWLFEHYPMIGVLMILLFAASWLTLRIVNWVHGIDNRFTEIDHRFTKIETNMLDFDKRLSRVEKRVARVEKRLTSVDKKVSSLDHKVSGLDKKMDLIISMFKQHSIPATKS